ncbi:hypothetical protein EIP91_002189 [Steccherinum ochraceum]|uniref:F-box domain-containing protein n=1 Tax=Steccherinum ochraceum TaxID=92696 RepID=A0A4R0RF25_9APHY|nr:hypothetical protein EIP91_002189 [Steccherinum ochraceum]
MNRSRGVPLEVHLKQLEELSPPCDDVIHVVLDELPRIRVLHLSLFKSTYVEYEDLLAESAEELETLEITFGDSAFNRDHMSRHPFPPTIMTMPVLSTLNISGFDAIFAVSLAGRACPSLQHLRIRVPHQLPENLATADILLDALHRMTRLITLDVGSSVLPTTLPPETRTTIFCPSLKSLRLAGRVSHMNWLLRHMQLPTKVTIDLAIFDPQPGLLLDLPTSLPFTNGELEELGNHLRGAFTSICSVEDNLPTPLSHAACFSTERTGASHKARSGPSMFHIMLSDSPTAIQDQFTASAGKLSYSGTDDEEADFDEMRNLVQKLPITCERTLHLRMYDTLTSPTNMVDTIWDTLPLHDVHTLFLSGVPRPTISPDRQGSCSTKLLTTFLNFVVPMTSVENLIVHGWEPFWLRELLVPNPAVYNDVRFTDGSFPSLRNLTLIRSPQPLIAPADEGKALRDVFRSRERKSRRIRNLFLRDYRDLDIVPLRLWMFFMQCVRDGVDQW